MKQVSDGQFDKTVQFVCSCCFSKDLILNWLLFDTAAIANSYSTAC